MDDFNFDKYYGNVATRWIEDMMMVIIAHEFKACINIYSSIRHNTQVYCRMCKNIYSVSVSYPGANHCVNVFEVHM